MKTTLNSLRSYSFCAAGWAKLLSNLGKTGWIMLCMRFGQWKVMTKNSAYLLPGAPDKFNISWLTGKAYMH